MDSDSRKPGVVGLKQVLRGLDANRLSAVYLADDAEEHIRSRVIERCRMRNVPVIPAESMSVLGCAAGIDIGAAVAGVVRDAT